MRSMSGGVDRGKYIRASLSTNIITWASIEDPAGFLGILTYVPESWICPDVQRLAKKFSCMGDGKPVPLGCTAGAAIPCALVCSLIVWTFYYYYMFLVLLTANCDLLGNATYRLTLWSFWVPCVVVTVLLEWRCLYYVAIPKFQVLGPPKMFGITLPFYGWLAGHSLLSVMSFADVATDSSFLALVLKNQECHSGSQLFAVWEYLVDNSPFGRCLPKMCLPSLATFCVVAWAAVFCNLFFALAEAIPVCSQIGTVDYSVMPADAQRDWVTMYNTLTNQGDKQNHGFALIAVGSAAGMASIVYKDLDFADIKANMIYHDISKTAAEKADLCFDHVRGQLQKGVQMTFLEGCMENAWQLNLQVTFAAMRSALNGVPLSQQWSILLSLLCSSFMLLKRLCESVHLLSIMREWIHVKIPDLIEEADDMDEDADRLALVHAKAARVKPWYYSLISLMMVCVLAWLYATIKFIMALRCPHALWSMSGCIEDLGAIIRHQDD